MQSSGENKEESNIEKLQKKLYSQKSPPIIGQKERLKFKKPNYEVPEDWRPPEDETTEEDIFYQTALVSQMKKNTTIFKKILIASLIFFGIAAMIMLYTFLGGANSISSKNVDITVRGLAAVNGGEELVLDIMITNRNNVSLELADLIVEYPPGTRAPSDLQKELLRYEEELGGIPSGGSAMKTVKAVLFGERNSVKELNIVVEYRAKGSTAIFRKEKKYEITIKSSPVIVSVNMPKEINANQEINIGVVVSSNSNVLIEDLLLKVDYPFGFILKSSNPEPAFDNSIWRIGDLKPREKKVITLKGVIEGQNEEEKTLRFHTGTADVKDEKFIAVDFASYAESILIKKPFISLNVRLNGSEGAEYIVAAGQEIQADFGWFNNLPTALNDIVIEAKLQGDALDRSRVVPNHGGFFRSIDNTVVWSKQNTPGLAEINPSDTGLVGLKLFSVKNPNIQHRNAEIILNLLIKGTRFSPGSPPELISYAISRKIKIATELFLNSRVVYSVGPFINTGGVPPKAEKETTYTIIWTLSNLYNDVVGARVSAVLPQYVKWLNKISPSGENIRYDSTNNTIIWEAGELKAGTGFASEPREAAFQISFLPSLSQVGTAPILLENILVVGADRFTGKNLELLRSGLNTKISTDPIYTVGSEMVKN